MVMGINTEAPYVLMNESNVHDTVYLGFDQQQRLLPCEHRCREQRKPENIPDLWHQTAIHFTFESTVTYGVGPRNTTVSPRLPLILQILTVFAVGDSVFFFCIVQHEILPTMGILPIDRISQVNRETA